MSYLCWAFWCCYYVLVGFPPTIEGWITATERTRAPWWKFTPFAYHNDDGRYWEVVLRDDSYYACRRTITVDVLVSQETDEIVGLHLFDEVCKK